MNGPLAPSAGQSQSVLGDGSRPDCRATPSLSLPLLGPVKPLWVPMYPHGLSLWGELEQRVAHALLVSFDSSVVNQPDLGSVPPPHSPAVWPGTGYIHKPSQLHGQAHSGLITLQCSLHPRVSDGVGHRYGSGSFSFFHLGVDAPFA